MHSRRLSEPVLPEWLNATLERDRIYPDANAQVAFAIALARDNVVHASGGPFGAAVFDAEGRLIAAGVNRVEPLRSSLAHAEIVALVGAQRALGRPRLHQDGHRYILATSAQPCCQCFGAILWAGIDELLVAARLEDTEALAGFDEGPLPVDWVGELERRGIRVTRDLQRTAACKVLSMYATSGGAHY